MVFLKMFGEWEWIFFNFFWLFDCFCYEIDVDLVGLIEFWVCLCLDVLVDWYGNMGMIGE